MEPVTITGVRGVIRWHTAAAADLAAWTVTRTAARQWSIVAVVANVDRYKLALTPLTLEIPTQHGRWVWPIEAVTVEGPRVRAQLGAFSRQGSGDANTTRGTGDRTADAVRGRLDRDQAGIDRWRRARDVYRDAAAAAGRSR